MRKSMDEALQPLGLTAAQFDVFQQLLHEDGLEHRVLQEQLVIASPTLTNIIDGMVARGLVERRISPNDARVKLLFLTPKAHSLCTQLDAGIVRADPSFNQPARHHTVDDVGQRGRSDN
jgi:DNA-binding MarR family transcriptional regulator